MRYRTYVNEAGENILVERVEYLPYPHQKFGPAVIRVPAKSKQA